MLSWVENIVSIRNEFDSLFLHNYMDFIKDCAFTTKDCALTTKDCAFATKDCALATKDCALATKDCAFATKDCSLTTKIAPSRPKIARSRPTDVCAFVPRIALQDTNMRAQVAKTALL